MLTTRARPLGSPLGGKPNATRSKFFAASLGFARIVLSDLTCCEAVSTQPTFLRGAGTGAAMTLLRHRASANRHRGCVMLRAGIFICGGIIAAQRNVGWIRRGPRFCKSCNPSIPRRNPPAASQTVAANSFPDRRITLRPLTEGG